MEQLWITHHPKPHTVLGSPAWFCVTELLQYQPVASPPHREGLSSKSNWERELKVNTVGSSHDAGELQKWEKREITNHSPCPWASQLLGVNILLLTARRQRRPLQNSSGRSTPRQEGPQLVPTTFSPARSIPPEPHTSANQLY